VEVSPERRATLEQEFYQGVAVRYEHVAAGLSVERRHWLDEIDTAFERERTVVVHAASGQGKTTLAFQFLSCLPSSWRFRIVAVPDRFHAVQMAAALEAHAAAVDLPVYVHLDVGPQDSEWPTFARQLAAHTEIRLLVTIREEDWRRSSDVALLPFADVDPSLGKSEAEAIYQGLHAQIPDTPPTFAEVWARFGGRGPLLEFVHLVTQGRELRARLTDQVHRLRNEALRTGAERIQFLRLVSVVAATGARADLRPLAEAAGLTDAAHAIASMEREYLLRLSDNGRMIGGLHPIRSGILAELLTDETLSPFSENLVAAVPFVTEADLEIFMLQALLRPDIDVDMLKRAALDREMESWVGFAGVGRALRWRGIADYADAHRELIEEIDPERSGRWAVVLDTDIARAMPGLVHEIWETLGRTLQKEDAVERVRAYQERQRPVDEAMDRFREWLALARPPAAPASAAEWSAFAEMHFFGARLGVPIEPAWLVEEALDGALETKSVSALADLSLALSEGDEVTKRGQAWLARYRGRLAELYRRDQGAVGLRDDGETISIDFIVSAAASAETRPTRSPSSSYNSQAVVRLDVLRRLIPDRSYYAAQGWGHRVDGLAFDGTQKKIERRRLPPLWLTAMNATFRGYVERWWRPSSWSSLRDQLVEMRRDTCASLETIVAGVERFHRSTAVSPLDGMTSEEWYKAWASRLSAEPLLPAGVIDEFGFTDESSAMADPTQDSVAERSLAVEPYLGFLRAWRELRRCLSNFANQAPQATAVAVALGRAAPEMRAAVRAKATELGWDNTLRLSAHNLADAFLALPAFQSQTARLFALDVELEQRERRAYGRANAAWRAFARTPWARSNNMATELDQEERRFNRKWQQQLRAALDRLDPNARWEVTERVGAEGGRLVLVGSSSDALLIYGLLERAVGVLHEAFAALSEDAKTSIRVRLPQLIVVPLLKGRSLRAEALSLSTIVVASEQWSPEWWHFVPRPIPSDLSDGFPVWDDGRLRFGDAVADAIAVLFALATHLVDLPRRDELDELGRDLLAEYVASIDPSPPEVWHSAVEKLRIFSAALAEVGGGAPYRGEIEELVAGLHSVLDKAPWRLEGAAPDEDEVAAWRPAIAEAMVAGGALRLAWATAVLDGASADAPTAAGSRETPPGRRQPQRKRRRSGRS